MYGSWDMEHDKHNLLSSWAIFCCFTPRRTWRIKILKKWKKHMEIKAFYTCVPQMTIICIFPEIWSARDRIFFVMLDHCWLAPPPPRPKNPEFKILKKWKNAWRYYHLTHVYHKWQSYVWFLRSGVQQTEFCFSLGHFLLLTRSQPKKSKCWKRNKPLVISSFSTSVLKIMITCYTVPEIWHMTDLIFYFLFWAFLPFYHPKEMTGDIIIMHVCTKSYNHMMCCSWGMDG